MRKTNPLFESDSDGVDSDEINFKEEFGGMPKSIMYFNKSNDLMAYLDEGGSKTANTIGHKKRVLLSGSEVRYSVYIPDQAVFILKYYTKENYRVLDPFMGRGTRSQMSLLLDRNYVGYDIDPETVQLNEQLSVRNGFSNEKYTYICGDGTELEEYKNDSNCFEAVFTCPPYYDAEVYSGKPGDLSYMSNEDFDINIDKMFNNLFRLIKESNYETNEIYPIIITIGSKREGPKGYFDMDYIFQNIARKNGLILWDKMLTENRSPFLGFTFRRNYKKGFLNKVHETTLVFVKMKQ